MISHKSYRRVVSEVTNASASFCFKSFEFKLLGLITTFLCGCLVGTMYVSEDEGREGLFSFGMSMLLLLWCPGKI